MPKWKEISKDILRGKLFDNILHIFLELSIPYNINIYSSLIEL